MPHCIVEGKIAKLRDMQKSLIGTRNYCDLHPHPCTSATCPYRIVGDKGQWAEEDAEKVVLL